MTILEVGTAGIGGMFLLFDAAYAQDGRMYGFVMLPVGCQPAFIDATPTEATTKQTEGLSTFLTRRIVAVGFPAQFGVLDLSLHAAFTPST